MFECFSPSLECSSRVLSVYNRTEHGQGFSICFTIKNPLNSPRITFNFQKRKKTREKSRKRLDIVQYGWWRDSFSSDPIKAYLHGTTLSHATCWKLDRECHVEFCMFLTPHELNFELLMKTQKRKMKRNAWKLSCILLFWNTVFIRSCPVVYVLYTTSLRQAYDMT